MGRPTLLALSGMLSQQQGPTSLGSIPLTASSREELRQSLGSDISSLSTGAAAVGQTEGERANQLIKEEEGKEEEEEEDKGQFLNLGLGGENRNREGASGIGAFL